MLVFRHCQLDSKEIKCFLQWWAKYEAMFPIVGVLAWQILKLVQSQIEIERIFSLAITKLRKCHL
jgi:hypothetical protein